LLPKSCNCERSAKEQKIASTCNTDYEEGNLRFRNRIINEKGGKFASVDPYRQSYFDAIIYGNCIFACPNVIEKIIHGPDSFIPDQLIIALTKKASFLIKNWQQVKQTHVRESGCSDFSMFFPFFTFSSDNIGTVERNIFIFTCRFRKSRSC